MAHTDYVVLDGAPAASPSIFSSLPFKAASGAAGLLLAGWAVVQASWAKQAELLNTSSRQSGNQDFVPKEGLSKVALRSVPGKTLSFWPPTLLYVGGEALSLLGGGASSMFLPTNRQLPAQVASGAESRPACLYGARSYVVGSGPEQVIVPTGGTGDVLDGTLLTWPQTNFKDKLTAVDKVMGYNAANASQGFLQRAIANAVKQDGTSVKAYYYFTPRLPRPEPDPRQARKAQEFIESFLLPDKLIGMTRASQVRVLRHVPGQPLQHNQKLLHLVRHGQGFHNLIKAICREGNMKQEECKARPELLDTPLTAWGRQQAKTLQKQTALFSGLSLVVVSPLARAVQTAKLAFQPALQSKSPPRFVAHQTITEQSGIEECNKRRPLTEIKEDFPMVSWSEGGFTTEQDPYWNPNVIEPGRHMADRAYEFLLWLRHQPDKQVAVVAHCGILFVLLNTAVTCQDPELTQWFSTGELRTVVMEFVDQVS
eukprot:gb/GEZN01007109.1/.p1 GENE.gb/GEZN01007109.1/~~gb/GEZN01007109.1/.p1  ORF type:complete len:493 (-),score=106.77 gb/GEZN01007109.1/:100-1548(-)